MPTPEPLHDPTEGAIPLNRTAPVGDEEAYIHEAIARAHIGGDGPFTRRCEALLADALSVERVLLTTSCTHALEMAALLLEVQPGDEVVVPSFTFVSTVNAFVLRGAKPVFADIHPDTCNIDEAALPGLISERTVAIVPVHYAGVACEMDPIMRLADAHGVAVVEDAAHALFGRYNERPAGTFGAFGTFSFHESKNFTCGEGGALALSDPDHIRRAEILREKGTNRLAFFRGQVDKYTWVDAGSSYVMSDMLAAHLYAQLERAEEVQAARRRIWERYSRELADWATENGVGLPRVPPGREQAYHLFYILLPSAEDRKGLTMHLKERDIGSAFHYVPLHTSPMGERFGYRPGDCPVTEDVSARLLRLPFFTSMSEGEQARVISAVSEFRPAA